MPDCCVLPYGSEFTSERHVCQSTGVQLHPLSVARQIRNVWLTFFKLLHEAVALTICTTTTSCSSSAAVAAMFDPMLQPRVRSPFAALRRQRYVATACDDAITHHALSALATNQRMHLRCCDIMYRTNGTMALAVPGSSSEGTSCRAADAQ
jgi:hypothetical protein